MNWDNQLNSILSVADGSVAKMRERLKSPGKISRVGEATERAQDSGHPTHLTRAAHHWPDYQSIGSSVQMTDLASIQSQLQIQSQAIESLTQKVHDMERAHHSQQFHIETLQEEVRRLRAELGERERERRELKGIQSPGTERRMEQWRREIGEELNSLRGHITRASSLGNLEESFSSKLRKKELENLQRDVNQLKTRLRQQEEDAMLQQAEARETRRRCERSFKTLEELTQSYRNHSADLAQTMSQYSHTQKEVCLIRNAVSEVKDKLRSILGERQQIPLSTTHTPGVSPIPPPSGISKGLRAVDSDSDDFSLTPSLAEISSDDLSWSDDKDLDLSQRPLVLLDVHCRQSDFTCPRSDLIKANK
uniref:Cingulin-like protein 1 n=1 Tax=Cynoglossus semilaevis TaxID=244447 RepID=A0A3P8VBY9_CYNSE